MLPPKRVGFTPSLFSCCSCSKPYVPSPVLPPARRAASARLVRDGDCLGPFSEDVAPFSFLAPGTRVAPPAAATKAAKADAIPIFSSPLRPDLIGTSNIELPEGRLNNEPPDGGLKIEDPVGISNSDGTSEYSYAYVTLTGGMNIVQKRRSFLAEVRIRARLRPVGLVDDSIPVDTQPTTTASL